MITGNCPVCSSEFDATPKRGQPRRFCSPKCRVAGHRAVKRLGQPFPLEMLQADRWARRSGKRPITAWGAPASTTNSTTWCTAAAVFSSRRGSGSGFMLGDGFACIDIDDCVVDGKLEWWAEDLLRSCPSTYIERSMSGSGLHVFGFLPPAPGRFFSFMGRRVEVYRRERFIAVTGDVWAGAPKRLADLSDVVARLV